MNARPLDGSGGRPPGGAEGLADALPDGLIEVEDGRLVWVNRAFLALVGARGTAEVVGRELGSLLEVAPEGRAGAGRGRLRRLDGEGDVPVQLTPLVETTAGRGMWLVRDRGEVERLADELAQAGRLAQLGLLVAGIAHEINNPLAYVGVGVEMLRDGLLPLLGEVEATLEDLEGEPALDGLRRAAAELDKLGGVEAVAETLEDVASGVDQVKGIVADLRTVSRVEARGGEGDLHAAVRSALNVARSQIRHVVRLEEDLAEVPAVACDEGRLAQVVLNLVMNAADALGSVEREGPTVRVQVLAEAGGALVRVSDNGPGIDAAVAAHIFEPFYTTKEAGRGTGLGLPLTRHIVESVGGRLRYRTEPGRGTTFEAWFPAVSRATPAPAEPEAVTSLTPIRRTVRVLVVDDEPAFCRQVARLLRGSFEVVTAHSAREAIARLEAGPDFDLVLSDLMMEGGSGADLFRWIEGHRPSLVDRVVFVTGGAVRGPERRFVEGVRNVVLEKPVQGTELVRLFRRLLLRPRRRLRARARERRAGPRVPGIELEARLVGGPVEGSARVVDFSVSGVRLTGLPQGDWASAADLDLSLRHRRLSGTVRARLRFVRSAVGTTSLEPCFRWEPRDPASRRTLRRWVRSWTI